MGGGEASRLMDTAEAIRAEMPKKKHFSHCKFKPRRTEPTDADQGKRIKKKKTYAERQSLHE